MTNGAVKDKSNILSFQVLFIKNSEAKWHHCESYQSPTHTDIRTRKPLVTFLEKYC